MENLPASQFMVMIGLVMMLHVKLFFVQSLIVEADVFSSLSKSF